MNNLNLNDKRVRDALVTLLNNEEFNECDIDYDAGGIEWVETGQILVAPITHKNFEKELEDWRVSAVINYCYHFTWEAIGTAEWNDVVIIDDNYNKFEKLLEAIKIKREAYDEDEGNQPSEDVDGIEDMSSVCPFCNNNYTDKDIETEKVTPCVRCNKCFVGECSNWACECVFSDDEEDEEDEEESEDEEAECS